MGKLKSAFIFVVVPLVLLSSYWAAFDYLELAPTPKKLFGNYLKKVDTATGEPARLRAGPTKFDFFMFSQQWAPSVWQLSGKPPQEFKIHGLWPEDYKINLNNGCKGRPQYKKIQDKKLIARLDVSWPNLAKPDNNEFWEAEYNKHGTCAFGYDQPQYFDDALKLKENRFNDLLTYLKNQGRGPGGTYKTDQIVSVVGDYTLTKGSPKARSPDLMCKKNGRRLVLCEIRICLDKNLKDVIDCPTDGTMDRSCYDGKGASTSVDFP